MSDEKYIRNVLDYLAKECEYGDDYPFSMEIIELLEDLRTAGLLLTSGERKDLNDALQLDSRINAILNEDVTRLKAENELISKSLDCEMGAVKALREDIWKLHLHLNSAREALKTAYRKHVRGDEDIGWDELGDILCNALCNIMGDEAFQEWLAKQRGG